MQEAVELPRVALHGFDRSNFSKNEVGFEKPLEHMEAVSPQCSDVTELDAATEPLHSDESQSQTEEPAREPEIGPEKQPPQPQQPQPQQPSLLTSCSSPQAFSVNARERQCGERFLELGKRLGRANEDVQDVWQRCMSLRAVRGSLLPSSSLSALQDKQPLGEAGLAWMCRSLGFAMFCHEAQAEQCQGLLGHTGLLLSTGTKLTVPQPFLKRALFRSRDCKAEPMRGPSSLRSPRSLRSRLRIDLAEGSRGAA